jgi:transposase-like protein
MTSLANTGRYRNHRFPGAIIRHRVWLSSRFTLRYRDVEELLFERGITVSHAAIHQWTLHPESVCCCLVTLSSLII